MTPNKACFVQFVPEVLINKFFYLLFRGKNLYGETQFYKEMNGMLC
jgi:hypothetical protein